MKVDYYTPTYYEGNFNITNTFNGEEGEPEPGTDQGGDTPKTGDTNTIGLWLALLIVAVVCVLTGLRIRKRSQNTEG